MTTTASPSEPIRPPESDPGALIDWPHVRERLGFALRAAKRRPLLWTCCFLAVASVGPISLLVMPRTYRVEAVVVASRNAVVSPLADPVLLRAFDAEDPANVARDAILRRDALVALCEETGLLERTLAERAPLPRLRDAALDLLSRRERTREQRIDALVERLEKRFAISVPSTEPGAPYGTPRDRIVLTLEWPNRETGRLLVDAAVRRFFESRRQRELSMSRDALAALESRAETVRQDIEAKVTKIHQLELEMLRGNPALSRTFRAPRGRVPQEQALALMRATLDSKRVALAEIERSTELRTEELRAELARQRTTYGDEHPIIARTREILDRVAAPSAKAETLRAEIVGLEQEFQRASERAARLVDDEDPALEYQRTEMRLLLAQYTSLRDRIDAARVESAIAQASFDRRYRFAVPAFLPRRATWPIPGLSLAASVLGGVLFAFFVAAVLDARSGRILERWQIERTVRLRVVGEFRA